MVIGRFFYQNEPVNDTINDPVNEPVNFNHLITEHFSIIYYGHFSS